ncbi:hypothetical protein EMIT0P43_50061 [Pseudomonas jessenii]
MIDRHTDQTNSKMTTLCVLLTCSVLSRMAGIFSYTQMRIARRVASKVSHEQEQSPSCRR